MEALRYPADYDGIIAGAPVNYRTHQLTVGAVGRAGRSSRTRRSYIPPAKYPVDPSAAALDACDARDGVEDGLIDDPAAVPVRSEGARVQGGRRTPRA